MADLLEAARLSVNETAHRLRVDRSTVWRWILKGKLPSYLFFGRRFVLVEDLEAFLRRGRAPPRTTATKLASADVRCDIAAEQLKARGV